MHQAFLLQQMRQRNGRIRNSTMQTQCIHCQSEQFINRDDELLWLVQSQLLNMLINTLLTNSPSIISHGSKQFSPLDQDQTIQLPRATQINAVWCYLEQKSAEKDIQNWQQMQALQIIFLHRWMMHQRPVLIIKNYNSRCQWNNIQQ